MVRAAKKSGASAVKFQSIKADKLVSPKTFSDSIDGFGMEGVKTVGDFWQKVSIDKIFHVDISNYCKEVDIEFMSTPFNFESVDIQDKLGVKRFKIASGDITHYPLLEYVASKKKPIILSTGASTMEEIHNAVDFIKNAGCDNLTLLHCVSLYPTTAGNANLRAIPLLKSKFDLSVGFSDHTLGYHIPICAIAIGAMMIEKHFTIDKSLPGPDQKISADPEEFRKMVEYGNDVYESTITEGKVISNEESRMIIPMRRSIVATKDLKKGAIIGQDDIDYKRPGNKISPAESNRILGKELKNDIKKEHQITYQDILGE